MGALAVNGSADFREGFGPLLADTTEIPFGDLDTLIRELKRGDVAAFIVEPIQGKGVYELEAERWRELENAVHSAGALFICDEVQTGLGRTGAFYAFEHYGLTPDIITISKALSGGYVPVGAMLTSDKILRGTYSSMDRAMVHSTTFKNNPMAMVAGLATLSVFDDEHVVEHAAAMGNVWRVRLEDLAVAPRVPPRHPRARTDDRHRVRSTDLARGASTVATDRGDAHRDVHPDARRPAVPPIPDLDPGRRRQHQRHQAAAATHRRRGRDRPLHQRAR